MQSSKHGFPSRRRLQCGLQYLSNFQFITDDFHFSFQMSNAPFCKNKKVKAQALEVLAVDQGTVSVPLSVFSSYKRKKYLWIYNT